MTDFIKPISKYEIYLCAPYIGSLTTIVFLFISAFLILYFDRGWMIVVGAIFILGLYAAGLSEHKWTQKDRKVYYQKGHLVVPKWIYNMHRKLGAYCKENNYQLKYKYFRCWITANGTTWLMYTFPRIPWHKTVIGFDDEEAKKFFLKVLSEAYQIDTKD